MNVIELFSQRMKRQQEVPETDVKDLLIYNLPQELRIQVVHILKASLGVPGRLTRLTGETIDTHTEHWYAVAQIVAENRGMLSIAGRRNPYDQVIHGILEGEDDLVLDIIEVAFARLERSKSQWEPIRGGFADRQVPSKAIADLNKRFLQWKVGYRFEKEQLIRVDSELMHEEVTKPALRLLARPGFAGPESEFLTAHAKFMKGEHREAITYAAAAFESTMKAICEKRGWPYNETDNAVTLVNACFTNGLIPEYLQGYMTSVRGTLDSGLNSLRNREGPHGGGAEIKDVPEHFAAFALHLAASNIIFLIESESKLIQKV